MVDSIMQHINFLQTLDRQDFGAMLGTIARKATQLLDKTGATEGGTAALPTSSLGGPLGSLHHPDNLEVCLTC